MANTSDKGQPVTTSLNSTREQMQKDLIYLQNIVSFYEQILKEPKFWNEEFLQEMASDPDFHFSEIQKALAISKELELDV